LQDRDEVASYLTGKTQRANAIDEKVRGETMIKRSQLMKSGKVVQGQGITSAEAARKRDSKTEEKRERREKKVCELLMEGERKIAGKTNCLQSQGRSFL
jgi:hypothetical protein